MMELIFLVVIHIHVKKPLLPQERFFGYFSNNTYHVEFC